MAYEQYTEGQNPGRYMRYLYSGYHIPNCDSWAFGDGEAMCGSEKVADIIAVAPDAPPLFKFVGRHSHWNKVQEEKRDFVRAEEIEYVYRLNLHAFVTTDLPTQLLNLSVEDLFNARTKLESALKKQEALTRYLRGATDLIIKTWNDKVEKVNG